MMKGKYRGSFSCTDNAYSEALSPHVYYTGSGRSKVCWSVVGSNNVSIIIHSFNLNFLPKMSYGVLECNIVTLQNYMLMIL